MKYKSTRGSSEELSFSEVLLSGLAIDGGLYLPSSYPYFNSHELSNMQNLSYPELAFLIMRPFIENDPTLKETQLQTILEDTYSNSNFDQIAPLIKIRENEFVLELFHGPTLAFKDLALQFLGRLFDETLKSENRKITIVGATSGDTGSAAIEACKNRGAINAFIFYPHNRVSEVQRRQMTTVNAKNIYCVAVDGTFDDCQDLVKAMFNDLSFRQEYNLSAINSINWARILAQVVYYFWAGLKLIGQKSSVSFSVPTGNFGNIFAGYLAKKMGLPISQLIVGSNSNDILTRLLKTRKMRLSSVLPTLSPSMDIQVSSNFERLLFLLYEGDSREICRLLDELRTKGSFCMRQKEFQKFTKLFDGDCFDDAQTKEIIKNVFEENEVLIDPHTAIGIAAARTQKKNNNVPVICLATAHPAKFPNTVQEATNVLPTLPKRLKNLYDDEEFVTILPNDLTVIKGYIKNTLSKKELR